jgi:hypothetical protein
MRDRHGRLGRTAAGTLSRRVVAALVAGVCVTVVALAVTGVVLSHRGSEVASIDGHPVTRDELIFHMRRLEPTVQNELRNAHRQRGPFDWSMSVGDGTALDRLTSRALDEIERDKMTFVLAEEHGIAVPIDHEDLLAQLADENDRRANALTSGEIVYGVTEFSAEEYYSHLRTQITTALKKQLSADADDPLWVDDADVLAAFHADRERWSANATTYRYAKLVAPLPDADAAAAGRLQRRVANVDRLAEVAARVPDATLTTHTYDSASVGASTQSDGLRTILERLAPGEISEPVVGASQVTYYELDAKAVDEDAALAEYAYRIRQSLVEEKFQRYLERRVDNSTAEIDAPAVDALNPEDVRQ